MKFIFVTLFFIIYTVSGATIYEYIPGIEYDDQVYVPLSQFIRVTRNADARHSHEQYHHPYMPQNFAHNSADAQANSAVGSFQSGGPPFGAGFGGYPNGGAFGGGRPSIGYTPGFGGGNGGAGKANAGASAGGFGNTQSTANAQSQTFTGNGFSGSASSASSSSSSSSFGGRGQPGFGGFGNFGGNSLSTAQAQSVS